MENSQAISISLYFHKSVCKLIFNAFFYRQTTQKFVCTKMNTYSNKINAYKDFHAFIYISLKKTYVTNLASFKR